MGERAAEVVDEQANVVRLRGRVAAVPQQRTLPSGDEIVTWRVIVPRDAKDTRARAGQRRTVGIDTIECSAWRPGLRRQVLGWQPEDVVEVDGALQRRFYRQGGQLVSRHEVVVRRVRRIARVARGGAVKV